MLKYKTSRLTEAIDSYFDMALCEADPAVTVFPSSDSEVEANKSTLEQFISTVFSDHSEDISNANIDYNGSDVEIVVDVNDESKIRSLVDLYKSKFELEGNENRAWSNVTAEEVSTLDHPCFVIKLILGSDSIDEEALYTYSLDDLYQITDGHDDARVVLEDIENSARIDDLLDLVNSKNFRTNDEVLDFMLSDEVDSLRSNDETFESESLTEDIGATRREVPLKLDPVEHDITNVSDMIGKYVKIKGNYHEIVDVKDQGDGLYTVSFSASTDGKTPGGEFEQGTVDQLSKLQLYQELKESIENKNLTEQVVPASELGFKHQELAKIEDEVALISKLKGEDPGNELYTDLLGCFDKAIEILKDAIGEDPVGTVVGKDDVAIEFDRDSSLGDGGDESVSDIDSEDTEEENLNLEEPSEDEEEV